jgi:large subunit ribosomal protein L29
MKEVKEMSEKDLHNKLVELRKDLMKLNSQAASGTSPESPGRLRQIKRTIAKILTAQSSKKQIKIWRKGSKSNE